MWSWAGPTGKTIWFTIVNCNNLLRLLRFFRSFQLFPSHNKHWPWVGHKTRWRSLQLSCLVICHDSYQIIANMGVSIVTVRIIYIYYFLYLNFIYFRKKNFFIHKYFGSTIKLSHNFNNLLTWSLFVDVV